MADLKLDDVHIEDYVKKGGLTLKVYKNTACCNGTADNCVMECREITEFIFIMQVPFINVYSICGILPCKQNFLLNVTAFLFYLLD